MVLFLHNRYRTTGGEERVVDELVRLVRERLGEPAELLTRESAGVGQARAAAGLLRGGLAPRDVAKAVRLSGARVVHAHNLNPLLGWRALAAAREAGARVVLHLHQYRLVCATGVCFTAGEECTRCHGRNTLPGLIHNCRGSRAEALAYGASLAMWQGRMAEQADAVIVPSVFARERLRELGAPLDFARVHVLAPPLRAAGEIESVSASDELGGDESELSARAAAAGSPHASAVAGSYALVVSRLAPEKGVDVAIDACRMAGVPLVVAGDGPEKDALRARASHAKLEDLPESQGLPKSQGLPNSGALPKSEAFPKSEGLPKSGALPKSDGLPRHMRPGEVNFVGRVDDAELARLRKGAALAIVPSRSAETFGMAAAEAMAAGVPVVASRIGALPELVEESALVRPGDAGELAAAIGRLWADGSAGRRGRSRVRELCSPDVVARRLGAIYGSNRVSGRRV